MPEDKDKVVVTIDLSQFSRAAALRAAYWFTKDLFIEFPPSESSQTLEIVLCAKPVAPSLDNPRPKTLDELTREFRNALVDAELRVRIQEETSGVRELLLAKAFAEAGVLEDSPPGEFSDPVMKDEGSETREKLVKLRTKASG